MKSFAQLVVAVLAGLGAWWLWSVPTKPWFTVDTLGSMGLPLAQWGAPALAIVLAAGAAWLVIRAAKN